MTNRVSNADTTSSAVHHAVGDITCRSVSQKKLALPQDSFIIKKGVSENLGGKTSEKVGKKQQRVKGGKHNQGRSGGYSGGRARAVRTFNEILPDAIEVVLPWVVNGVIRNSGVSFASLRYQSSGLYDPDPLLGGTSFLGLSQWAALYAYYRPVELMYKLRINNNEAFPMMVHVYNSNGDPGATVGTAGTTFAMNQFGKSKLLDPVTGGKASAVLQGKVPFAKLLGRGKDLLDDDLYRGFTASSNPPDMFWFGFNTDAMGTLQTAAGAQFQLEFKVRTIVYDRGLLS